MSSEEFKSLESLVAQLEVQGNIKIYEGKVYKEIPNNSGYYCSTDGTVIGPNGKPIVLAEHYTGYYKVHLRSGKCFAHRVVMLTFNPHPDSEMLTVNHKDRNKKNNNLDNLEWLSIQDNIKHYQTTDDIETRKIIIYKLIDDFEDQLSDSQDFEKIIGILQSYL